MDRNTAAPRQASVATYLKEFRAGLVEHGSRALRIELSPRGELDERDVALLA